MCCAFSNRINIVVAADTVVRNVRVIEKGRQPANRRMTVFAIVASW